MANRPYEEICDYAVKNHINAALERALIFIGHATIHIEIQLPYNSRQHDAIKANWNRNHINAVILTVTTIIC